MVKHTVSIISLSEREDVPFWGDSKSRASFSRADDKDHEILSGMHVVLNFTLLRCISETISIPMERMDGESPESPSLALSDILNLKLV